VKDEISKHPDQKKIWGWLWFDSLSFSNATSFIPFYSLGAS